MKSIVSILLAVMATVSFAQRPAADVIQTSKGPLSIQPVKHATLVFTWGGKTIYADPDGGKAAFEGLADPDLILITDIHGDHFNVETLNALNTDHATLIVPQAVADKLPDNLKSKAVVLNNGKTVDKLNASIKAIPMYNLPESPDAKHTKGRGNGYVLTFGNKTVYISGDTAGVPEMRALKNIDVAFVCMNLPYTMPPDEAADAVKAFDPKVVIPYHYRGSDLAVFQKGLTGTGIEVRLLEWYPK